MASLSQLLETKRTSFRASEDNIEQGQIWVYGNSGQYTSMWNGVCWQPPGCGQVVIEMWGASGSSAKMCCCGMGIPGNPGAYSKKTLTVDCNTRFLLCSGKACANADALCFRGCSSPSFLYWCNALDMCCNKCGFMCAEGGRGGMSICTTGTSANCCFCAWFCTSLLQDGCIYAGVVCNKCIGGQGWEAKAYGGDVNCCGGFSCTTFYQCQAICMCQTNYHIAVSPGVLSRDGAVLTYTVENNNEFSNWSGQGWHESMAAMNAAGRFPGPQTPWTYCWGFGGGCGCYDDEGCHRANPIGLPGAPPHPCPDVRDAATTGGDGAIRIKFIAR